MNRAITTVCAFLLAIALCSAPAVAQAPQQKANWDAWNFLIGEWTGEGGGGPGQGTGSFSFALDLQGQALVRRNHSDYPAAAGNPAYTHDDLMVIYQESKNTHAVYFDSEGHVIHYDVSIAIDGKSVTFVSEALSMGPRFRLSYVETKPGAVSIKFEIAPPGKPDSFSTYIEATAHRK